MPTVHPLLASQEVLATAAGAWRPRVRCSMPLASRPRKAPRALRRVVPTSAQTFAEFELSAVQSDARSTPGRTLIDARTAET